MFERSTAYRLVICVLCFETASVSGQHGNRRIQKSVYNPHNESEYHVRHENPAGKRSSDSDQQHKEIEYRLTKLEVQVEDKASLLKELEYRTFDLQAGLAEIKNEGTPKQPRMVSEDSLTLKELKQDIDELLEAGRLELGIIEILHRDVAVIRKATSLLLEKYGELPIKDILAKSDQTENISSVPEIPADLFKVPGAVMAAVPRNCRELQERGEGNSGIYNIKPVDTAAFMALCDMDTQKGGWTFILNRYDGSQNFFRDWLDYKTGFGNLAGEFWLGLDHIHELTREEINELLIELVDANGQKSTALYSAFSIGNEQEGYMLKLLGGYTGTAGDSLIYHAGSRFSTRDNDQDGWVEGNCAIAHGGAWWYKSCDKSNLNGRFLPGQLSEGNIYEAMYWDTFGGPLQGLAQVRMMVRPRSMDSPVLFSGGLKNKENITEE